MTNTTRADLMQHPAFANLGTDSDGNPCVWENCYSCRVCSSEQIDWSDVWSCQCNDECPNCGAEVEPFHSQWIGPEDATLQKLWASLPDGEGQGWGASVMPACDLDAMIKVASQITDQAMTTVEVYAYLSSLRPHLRLEFHGADAEGRWIINATGGKAIMRRATVIFDPNTLW